MIRMLIIGYCHGIRSERQLCEERNIYICPAGKIMTTTGRVHKDNAFRYLASVSDCRGCPLKSNCCPNMPSRRIARDIHEEARDVARAIVNAPEYDQSRRERKKVEMAFAHLMRILKLGRLRLRGPSGARDEFMLAATAQNLRKLVKLVPMPPGAAALTA